MDKKEYCYCEDYCPIYQVIDNYNWSHKEKIYCTEDMCLYLTETVRKNMRLEQ